MIVGLNMGTSSDASGVAVKFDDGTEDECIYCGEGSSDLEYE